MSRDYDWCLEKRRIVRQEYADDLIDPELKDAKDDLSMAKKTFADSGFKWATIQAYYSMFHAARALLFSKGFREKSHSCLKAAIAGLYVETGLLENEYLADFDSTMLLRESADYKSDFSREGAEAAIDNAERFLARARALLSKS